MNIKNCLRAIFRKSEETFSGEDSLGTPDLIPFSNQIIKIYKNNPEYECLIEEAFIEDFNNYKECTWELAAVCMYHLKLPKFKLYLEKELLRAKIREDWRAIPVIENILSAYATPWEDFDLFYSQSS